MQTTISLQEEKQGTFSCFVPPKQEYVPCFSKNLRAQTGLRGSKLARMIRE
jgi:hypothetical protein